jgi:nitrite reductase/ring-hydroxylating ferredoxin subunit
VAGADGWTDVGAAAELAATPLQRIAVGNSEIALSFRDGSFGAVANACNHAGGPLGEGCLDSDYIVCPWHHWKFHRVSGVGEPGFEEDRVPSFPVKVEHGRVLVNLRAATRRTKKPHPRFGTIAARFTIRSTIITASAASCTASRWPETARDERHPGLTVRPLRPHTRVSPPVFVLSESAIWEGPAAALHWEEDGV